MSSANLEVERTQICRWHAYPQIAALERAAADWVGASARLAIASRHAFHVVLAGGSTPRGIYEQLKLQSNAWADWHIYYGDERCLPASDAQRNSTMANDAWLAHVSIPIQQVHDIPGELGAVCGAQQYAKVLDHVPIFDLCLLGLGEDGHTASLFPGNDLGAEADAPTVLAIENAPKPPPQRISLSARRLSLSREVLVCVAGANKRQAVSRWRAGEALPISAVNPPQGVDVLISETGCV